MADVDPIARIFEDAKTIAVVGSYRLSAGYRPPAGSSFAYGSLRAPLRGACGAPKTFAAWIVAPKARIARRRGRRAVARR